MKLEIVKIIILSIIILMSFSLKVNAKYIDVIDTGIKIADEEFDVTKPINPNTWKPDKPDQNSEEFNKKVGKLLGAIQNYGIIASVISLMIIGLRTMYGSIEEKSHYKELFPTFLIGVFILLSCTIIPNIIYQVFIK